VLEVGELAGDHSGWAVCCDDDSTDRVVERVGDIATHEPRVSDLHESKY